MSRSSALIKKGRPKHEGPRTYIVFGVVRGGTTMVAGIMRAFGLFMGPDIDPTNQESSAFKNTGIDNMKSAIQEVNEDHETWGWKFPNAADYLDRIWPEIRNPHLICVFRDSVANGRGLSRWHPLGEVQAVQENLLRLQKNMNLVSLRQCPSLLISYEKAQRNKEQFINEFSDWLGVEAGNEKFDFDAFMKAESYKVLSDYFIEPD